MVNWDNATWATPVDAYAMSQQELRTVRAAAVAATYECLNGQSALSSAQEVNVRSWLADARWSPQRWLFGFWQASWLSQTGNIDDTGFDVGLVISDEEWSRIDQCDNNNPGIAVFDAVAPNVGFFGYGQLSAQVTLVGEIWGESYERTKVDSRYLALNEQRNACTIAKGYVVAHADDRSDGYVDTGSRSPNGASAEARLTAALAEAQCADDMDYTRQAVDIMAGYQQQLISEHEAELVAVRQVVDDRVTKATQTLHEAGLL